MLMRALKRPALLQRTSQFLRNGEMIARKAPKSGLDKDFNQQECSINDVAFDWLRRIESILRNGLPTNDKAEASTITHAHSEVEKALEDISPDWWMP